MPMTVEELSRRSGVAANTVRYYTRIELLNPQRHPLNGYRLFNEGDLRQLTFIVVAKQLGFSLSEIRRLIETSRRGGATGVLARRMVEQRVVEIRSQIDALRDLQARMEAALTVWDRVPDHTTDRDSICAVVERVSAQVSVVERTSYVEIGCRLPSCRLHESEARAVGD